MIDKSSGMPAYRQIADVLRERIVAGAYEPGAQIPSERDLVAEFQVSRPTIRQAVDLLRNDGTLLAEHGRGVFVRPARVVERLARNRLSRQARADNRGAFLGDAAEGGWAPSVSVRVRFESADERVAGLLRIDPGSEVCVRDRVMSADGVPVQLAVTRLAREVTRETVIEQVDTGPGGLYARLEDLGHELTEFEEIVAARMPTAAERSQLQLVVGTPVIAITRIAHAAGGPVEVNDMVVPADRYQLHYLLPVE